MKYLFIFCLPLLLLTQSCEQKREGRPRILVFSRHADFVHTSIPAGMTMVQKLGAANGFEVDTTKDASAFTEDNLAKYSAVVFLSTTGNVLNRRQEAAFERYIQAGGGFVGIHAATDTEYDWGWYGRLVGAYFVSHPEQQQARFVIKDRSHPSTVFFADSVWQRFDELYNFKWISPDIHVLVTIDETSYKGGIHGAMHPMSWYHDYDGGRAFYTALGHTEGTYGEELFEKHLLGGIQYAIGNNLKLNYRKAHTEFPPDDDRFVKTQLALAGEFYEPTEMTILPNLDVLIVQRRGQVLLYKNETGKVKQVGFLEVYCKAKKSNANVEEGLLGLAKDPNYAKNHWVYLFYSAPDSAVNRLSRFTFENDTLLLSTERTIIEVKSQREICCHTGGSVAFGPDGLLYLSTGDNSTPFDEPGEKYVNSGYGPLNDTPGHGPYDARRSSGNTNDLRGKILRIRVNDDGSYSIPEGNLFPVGTAKARPEIYVMGNRNPYRISVDQKNSTLYWGEVGPDASVDSLQTRGPRGYDELNQARKAGFFGWPLFVGNNYPYLQYNYVTGESGPAFDPKHPVNDSRNNTGLRDLPPVSPAFIWYPYGPSHDFPQVGAGGRNAMAGPVYYTDMFPKETRLPDYYNGKVIIYDWIRGWMKAVTLQPNGDFDRMEPFAPSVKTNSMIDLEVGPDGRLYMLEYGTGWFTQNPDAGLARLDFISGNRPPQISKLQVNKTSGQVPCTIKASLVAKDPDKDPVRYQWRLGNGEVKETESPTLEYTYQQKGSYWLSVRAVDDKGGVSQGDSVQVYAGNEAPEVSITLEGGNQSFYLPGIPIAYKVDMNDKEDGTFIDPDRLLVSADYVEGAERDTTPAGHLQSISGRALMQSLDCKSCHKESDKSIGPAYVEVSRKYRTQPNSVDYLVKKIINGGSGVWGKVSMAAHPNLSTVDARIIVNWIFTLDHSASEKSKLLASGTVTPAQQPNAAALVLSATYTDKGGDGIEPQTGRAQVILPANRLSITGKESIRGFIRQGNSLVIPSVVAEASLGAIDLSHVETINVLLGWVKAPVVPLRFEIRKDDAGGELLGAGTLSPAKRPGQTGKLSVKIKPTTGMTRLVLVYRPGATQLPEASVTGLEFTAKGH